MCYHDLPTEFPPLGWHDIKDVAKVVALALAAIFLISLFAPLQLGHWRAVERHTEIASAAVEPRVWR